MDIAAAWKGRSITEVLWASVALAKDLFMDISADLRSGSRAKKTWMIEGLEAVFFAFYTIEAVSLALVSEKV